MYHGIRLRSTFMTYKPASIATESTTSIAPEAVLGMEESYDGVLNLLGQARQRPLGPVPALDPTDRPNTMMQKAFRSSSSVPGSISSTSFSHNCHTHNLHSLSLNACHLNAKAPGPARAAPAIANLHRRSRRRHNQQQTPRWQAHTLRQCNCMLGMAEQVSEPIHMLIHSHSQEPDPTTNARAVPIYATTV